MTKANGKTRTVRKNQTPQRSKPESHIPAHLRDGFNDPINAAVQAHMRAFKAFMNALKQKGAIEKRFGLQLPKAARKRVERLENIFGEAHEGSLRALIRTMPGSLAGVLKLIDYVQGFGKELRGELMEEEEYVVLLATIENAIIKHIKTGRLAIVHDVEGMATGLGQRL